MHLTDQDKRILDGEEGPARQKAMELLVRYGEVMAADEMCSVTWADLFCGCHSYLDVVGSTDFDEVFSKMALCTDETVSLEKMAPGCICYAGVEPDCTEVPEKMFMSPDKQALNLKFLSRFVDAGVILSGNCIPYFTGFVPVMGEHFVSCESSAVLFMNSLWGARGNGDGIEAAFCAAVCGRTPRTGMHRGSGRGGTIAVDITTDPVSLHDWDALGYALGAHLPAHSVPVFTGNFKRPNTITLKTFFASLACSAGTEMCHMVGITPEASTREAAFQGKQKVETLHLDRHTIHDAVERLTARGNKKIDYITIGCPHLHVDELRQVAEVLRGKKIHPDTQLDIWTTGPMKYLAQRGGYCDAIEASGAHLVTGGCPSNRGYPEGTGTVAFDSTKQRQDAPIDIGRENIFFGSRRDCLASAVSGKWEGGVSS